MLLVLLYVVYAVTNFLLAALMGTVVAILAGRAHPHFASPGFVGCFTIIFGAPYWFSATYIHTHGSVRWLILVGAATGLFGFIVGTRNRAQPNPMR